MENKKDALNENIMITKIYLKQEFHNTQITNVYKVTAPNGYSQLFRQTLSPKCQHMLMWEACGCGIDMINETREVRGCKIKGVQLKQNDLKELEYQSKGKATATEIYINKVKPGLKIIGYDIIDHVCEPYIPNKTENSCHDGTVLDPKY